MQKAIGVLLILVVAFLAFRMLVRGWLLLLLLGGVAAAGSATGLFGKWGYGIGLLLFLLAMPGLMFGSLAMVFRLLPLIVVGYLIYRLVQWFK